MEYTKGKGKWKYNRPSIEANGNIICTLTEPHFMPDCGDVTWYNGCVEAMQANAHLITAAVNACISVNPDNPMAVAESIKDMYEALKVALVDITGLVRDTNWENKGQELEIATRHIRIALAKAEGK